MLCFSPTVWVSGNRTALFFYFSMIIASCLLISRYHHRIKNLDYFMAIFGVFAFCNIINYLLVILFRVFFDDKMNTREV